MTKQYWKKVSRGMIAGRAVDVDGSPTIEITLQKRGHKWETVGHNPKTGTTVFVERLNDRLLDAVTECALEFTMALW